MLAGAFAGAIEGFATVCPASGPLHLADKGSQYPAEFVKTESQFGRQKHLGPISIVKETLSKHGVTGLYSGCGALVAGNALKAGVRFFSYDKFKGLLVNQEGKLTGPRSLIAGLGAGMCEYVICS